MTKINIDCYPDRDALDLMILSASRKGDDGSVAEELLAGRFDLEAKIECVIKSTVEGYFSFPEALVTYSLALDEFRSYFNEKY